MREFSGGGEGDEGVAGIVTACCGVGGAFETAGVAVEIDAFLRWRVGGGSS